MITRILASLALAATSTAALSQGTDLQAIAGCISAGPIKGVETQRRTGAASTRSIGRPGEPERQVSVLEGYRVMLATAPGQYFVNLKIERSAHDKADEDRDIIRKQMQSFAASGASLKQEQDGGVETLGLDEPSLDRSGTLGFYTFFVPRADLVVTAYLLNQRAFASYADYERLRDQALKQVKGCLP